MMTPFFSRSPKANRHFDYVIVGAGSAGCVLANRLSQDGKYSVCLLETGGSDNNWRIQMPAALSIPMNMPKYTWGYQTLPEPGLNNRVMQCPRGKVLGGSSAINGMVYVRGHAEDFDEWQQLGASGWNYANCLPYFKKVEQWQQANEYRSDQGAVNVCYGNQDHNPLYQAFIHAGKAAGYGISQDYNGALQEGFARMQMTVKDGKRHSAAAAYIHPAKNRSNLTIFSHALCQKILLTGTTATGVQCQINGQNTTILADKEVIVSSGAIGSPHLLQVSGIGNESYLSAAGIKLKHQLPAVGEQLKDHLEIYYQHQCKQPISLNQQLSWYRKLKIGARWLTNHSGMGASNHFEACGFIRSKAGLSAPDIQFHFLPAAIRYDGKSAYPGHGFQLHVGYNKPKSSGYIRAKSADIRQKPDIQFNYLQHPNDLQAMLRSIRLSEEILNQTPMQDYLGPRIQPTPDTQSDLALSSFLRQHAESAYHPAGSCRMGEGADTVVDSELKVHGLQHLRVVDSSVFPNLTNGNLNAPVLMLAERAADMILNKPLLPASLAKTEIAPNWREHQRMFPKHGGFVDKLPSQYQQETD